MPLGAETTVFENSRNQLFSLFLSIMHILKRTAYLDTLACLPCDPLDIFTYIHIFYHNSTCNPFIKIFS